MRTLVLIALFITGPAWCRAGDDTKKQGKTLAQCVAQLESADPKARVEACQVIGDWQRQAGSAVAPLVKLLKDKDAKVRFAAAGALGRIGPPAKDAVGALIELVQGDNSDIRVAALEALSGIGPRAKEAAPAVVNAAGQQTAARQHIIEQRVEPVRIAIGERNRASRPGRAAGNLHCKAACPGERLS